QPEVEPLVAGTATLTGAPGCVRVVGVKGAPAPLLTGWSAGLGVEIRDGAVADGHDAAGQLGPFTVLTAAELALAVAAAFGDDTIEWAAVGGRSLLLQSGACGRRPAPAPQDRNQVRVEAAGAHLTTAAGPARVASSAELHAHADAMAHGERFQGQPAAPGIAAGPARVAGGSPQRLPLPDRAVVVARYPLPHLAPLLWGAAAVVTFGGSPAAHLFQVARSLGVPAVAGCGGLDGRLAPDADAVLAVDGGSGEVGLA
ncbi:MAG TPA: PEP-utilizing enzyme, partial [Actinomycetota bacterium]